MTIADTALTVLNPGERTTHNPESPHHGGLLDTIASRPDTPHGQTTQKAYIAGTVLSTTDSAGYSGISHTSNTVIKDPLHTADTARCLISVRDCIGSSAGCSDGGSAMQITVFLGDSIGQNNSLLANVAKVIDKLPPSYNTQYKRGKGDTHIHHRLARRTDRK